MPDHISSLGTCSPPTATQKSKRDRWPNGFSDLVVQDISDTIEIRQWTLDRALSAGPEVLWVAALAEAEVLGHCHCFVEVAGQGPARDGDRRMGGRRPAHQKRTIPAR